MKRRVLRILLSLSLAISLVSLIAWPVSYLCAIRIAYIGRSSTVHWWTAGGQLNWLRQSGSGVPEILAANSIESQRWQVDSSRYRARHYDGVDRWNSFRQSLRFHTENRLMPLKSGRVIMQRHTILPFWPIAWLFAIPPAIAYQRRRVRQRRIRDGLCVACGYDLRVSGDRCPECGAPRGATLNHAKFPPQTTCESDNVPGPRSRCADGSHRVNHHGGAAVGLASFLVVLMSFSVGFRRFFRRKATRLMRASAGRYNS